MASTTSTLHAYLKEHESARFQGNHKDVSRCPKGDPNQRRPAEDRSRHRCLKPSTNPMSIVKDVKEERREVQGLDEEGRGKRRRSAPYAKDRRTTPEDSRSRH